MINLFEVRSIQVLKHYYGEIYYDSYSIEFDDVIVKGNKIRTDFIYPIIYKSKENNSIAARIYFRGRIESDEPIAEAKKIDEFWTKERSLPLAFVNPMIQLIHTECRARGVLLSYAIEFPPPFKPPKIEITINKK